MESPPAPSKVYPRPMSSPTSSLSSPIRDLRSAPTARRRRARASCRTPAPPCTRRAARPPRPPAPARRRRRTPGSVARTCRGRTAGTPSRSLIAMMAKGERELPEQIHRPLKGFLACPVQQLVDELPDSRSHGLDAFDRERLRDQVAQPGVRGRVQRDDHAGRGLEQAGKRRRRRFVRRRTGKPRVVEHRTDRVLGGGDPAVAATVSRAGARPAATRGTGRTPAPDRGSWIRERERKPPCAPRQLSGIVSAG